jgi:hypothetical protein
LEIFLINFLNFNLRNLSRKLLEMLRCVDRRLFDMWEELVSLVTTIDMLADQ